MSSAARRLADLEVIARNRHPEGPPTWTFFAQERFRAAANYGNQSPDVVLDDVEAVERVIAAYDDIRREHHLNVIDLAILISRYDFPDHAQTASGIAGSLVQAFWYWDRERFGEDKAWRKQRSQSEFEGQIAGRLDGG